jgi:hypothetical protein
MSIATKGLKLPGDSQGPLREGLCPEGDYVDIGARVLPKKKALSELCKACPTMKPSPTLKPTRWTALGGHHDMDGKIIVKSGTTDETDTKVTGEIHFSDEEQDKLLMCATGERVPLELKEYILGRKYDHSLKPNEGPNRDFNWKNKQREIHPGFILDEILGHLDQPVIGPGSGAGIDSQNLFHKCMAAKVDEDLTAHEFMKEIMSLSLDQEIGDCIDRLDEDKCDQGFSDEFISLPAALRKTRTMSGVSRNPLSYEDQDIVLDVMINQSAETEKARCDEKISDTTKSLQETRRYEIDTNMSSWFFNVDAGWKGTVAKIVNFIVVIALLYLIGKIISNYKFDGTT